MNSTSTADVVIIGGGIWGLSTAYHLALEDGPRKIVVLERNSQIADETTRQAAGQIGQLRSDPLMSRAVGYGLDLLSRFEEETGHDPGFRRSGSLHLALVPERMNAFRAQLASASKLGVTVEVCGADRISSLAPSIDASTVHGAIHLPDDAYVDALQCAQAYAASAKELGVEVITDARAVGIVHDGGRIATVETTQGRIDTHHAVIACGPYSGIVAAMAGISLPMYPIRLQQARTVIDPDMPPGHPVVRIPDQSCYLRPEQGGYLFGFFDPEPLAINIASMPDSFTTRDIQPPTDVIDEARRRLAPVFPILDRLPIDQYRQGMVTCSPDAAYIVGPTPTIAGLWIATACGAMGIAGSAAVGRWLAGWITRGDPGDDLSALAPERFQNESRDQDWLREACRHVCASYYSLQSPTYSMGSSHD